MVLNKLLGKKKSPKIVGEGPVEGPKDLGKPGNTINRYYVEFPKISGSPTFLLEDSLTIGSESPEALVQEEGVAPSHCSLNLNHDVISIVDHGSPEGTFVNKKRITPGKMVILGAKDKLKAGKAEFVIVERQEPETPIGAPGLATGAPVPEATQEIDQPLEKHAGNGVEDGPPEDLPEEIFIEEDQDRLDDEIPEEKAERPKAKKSGFKVKGKGVATEAANGFLRVLGLICDALIVGIIHSVARGNQVYDDFLEGLPAKILNSIKPLYSEYGASATAKAVEALPALKNGWQFLVSLYEPEYIIYVQLLLMLAVFRLVGPVLFGATLGQCLAGIRGKGNFFLKRLLSPLRWFFGLALAPFFWLLDFPTLFSKRSFKEVASFTHLETPSNIMAIVSLIIFIPVLSLALLTAPVWKSLEAPSPIPFTPMKKVELGVFDPSSVGPYSGYFDVGLPKKAAVILPQFKFSQKGGKKSLDPSLLLGGDGKGLLELKMLRRVSLVKLLENFSKGNPIAELRYPQIAALVHDASNTSKHFKDSGFPEQEVAKDIQKLMLWSSGMLEADPKKIFGFLKENGPFLGGFVEFRKALESALGEGAKSYALKQIGNAIHIIGDFSVGNRVVRRFLPINAKETKVYEISYEKDSDPSISEQIELMIWNGQQEYPNQNDLVGFVDLLDSGIGDEEKILDIFQGVNQAYYDFGKTALLENRQTLLRELMKSVQGSIEVLKNSKALGIPAAAGNKLTQNLNDILKALKDQDLEYFGVSAVGANI